MITPSLDMAVAPAYGSDMAWSVFCDETRAGGKRCRQIRLGSIVRHGMPEPARNCGNCTMALRGRRHRLAIDGLGGPSYKTADFHRLRYNHFPRRDSISIGFLPEI